MTTQPEPTPQVELPLLEQPLAQHEREMYVGAFLDVYRSAWAAWILAVGDDAIPTELHDHVTAFVEGLTLMDNATEPDLANAQQFLQHMTLLSDSAIVWLVQQVGVDPRTGIASEVHTTDRANAEQSAAEAWLAENKSELDNGILDAMNEGLVEMIPGVDGAAPTFRLTEAGTAHVEGMIADNAEPDDEQTA